MATFRFGRDINIHWNGYDIKGPANTVFSIPDQLYEEFEGDLRGAEPTLEWIDTNEFLTLTNAVSVTTLAGTYPISATSTSSGKTISIVSTSASSGYVLTANGAGGVTWSTLPADATGITNIIGTSPISAAVSGTTATISLNANYQTAGSYQASGNYASSVSATLPISASLSTAGAVSISINTTGFQSAGSYQPSGTYVTGVVGTSPISATGTTAITVSLNANYQTAGTYVNAVIGTSPASVSTASGTSTVSIVAGSINSTHLSATSVGSSQLIAQAVGTVAISSGAATSGQLLQANGSGGVSFQTVTSGVSTLDITANVQTVAYTLALTDKDKMVEVTLGTALNITIPPNSTVAFGVGAQVHILRAGAGAVTIVAGTGVTVNSSDGLKLRAQWSSATAIKRATNTWVVLGDTTP